MKTAEKPFVSVDWFDAHGSSTSELEEHELPSEPARYTTHGLLVKECAAVIVVAGEETPQRTYRQWSVIPRVNIISIKRHGETRKRKKKGATDAAVDVVGGVRDHVSGTEGEAEK